MFFFQAVRIYRKANQIYAKDCVFWIYTDLRSDDASDYRWVFRKFLKRQLPRIIGRIFDTKHFPVQAE